MMVIDNTFELGDEVYIKTDREQELGIITEICVRPGNLIYQVSIGCRTAYFYDFELSKEKNSFLTLT